MNYQFDQLEQLVSVVGPEYFAGQRSKAVFAKKYRVLIRDEALLAASLIRHEFINCENDQQAKNYLQYHQHSIIKLLDRLFEFETNILKQQVGKRESKSYSLLIQDAQNDLQQILHFLESESKNYFQDDAAIPQAWISKYTITVKLLRIKLANLEKEGRIDGELYNILSAPLTSFILNRTPISFSGFKYLNEFVSNHDLLLEGTDINDNTICDFLLANNFNHFSFFNYYIKKINSDNLAESCSLTHFNLQLKKINQVQKKTTLAFDKDQPSILDQVGRWLAEEIYFLEKKQLYNSHTSTISAEKALFEDKIDTKLSVSNLSLAVRLLVDTGVIKNRNLSAVIKMVAASFRTEKSERISEDSLRNKIYSIESSSVETMKDIIINLLNAVKKY